MLTICIIAAITIGLLERGRGWGNDGWRLGGGKWYAPKWLIWVQATLLGRVQISFASAFIIAFVADRFGFTVLWWHPIVAGGLWLLGIALGKGEYQDGKIAANHELPVIDWLAPKMLPKRLRSDANAVDSLSMALRGLCFIPMYVFYGYTHGPAAAILPSLFFWQEGAFYYALNPVFANDDPNTSPKVMFIELGSGAVRGAVICAGLAVAAFLQ